METYETIKETINKEIENMNETISLIHMLTFAIIGFCEDSPTDESIDAMLNELYIIESRLKDNTNVLLRFTK
ncbi:hypothetical protein ACTNED_09625 [Absicoccus porci]|uniref:hypothetical protein n=1 Tax=Absicoccus porci TaxID=2486576 RepID=UPI003F8A3EAC